MTLFSFIFFSPAHLRSFSLTTFLHLASRRHCSLGYARYSYRLLCLHLVLAADFAWIWIEQVPPGIRQMRVMGDGIKQMRVNRTPMLRRRVLRLWVPTPRLRPPRQRSSTWSPGLPYAPSSRRPAAASPVGTNNAVTSSAGTASLSAWHGGLGRPEWSSRRQAGEGSNRWSSRETE